MSLKFRVITLLDKFEQESTPLLNEIKQSTDPTSSRVALNHLQWLINFLKKLIDSFLKNKKDAAKELHAYLDKIQSRLEYRTGIRLNEKQGELNKTKKEFPTVPGLKETVEPPK